MDRRAIRPVLSCPDCLAWGVTGYRGRCIPCLRYTRSYPLGPCEACARVVPLRMGHCRLCWDQGRLDRPYVERHTVLLPHVRQVRAHQLCFAGMTFKPRADRIAQRRAHRRTVDPADHPLRQPDTQLPLFGELARSYRYGRIDLRREPLGDNPVLRAALALAAGQADVRGWSDVVVLALNRNLVMLLTDLGEGERVRYSDYAEVLRARSASLQRTTDILAGVGVLLDDRVPAFHAWIDRQLADLAPDIAAATRAWALTLTSGDVRTRSRKDRTIRGYVAAARPALLAWSGTHTHLREITHDDLVAVAADLHGHRRITALVALRSLFGWAKRTGLIFTNPAARVRVGQASIRLQQPLAAGQIELSLSAGTTPQARVFLVLAAVHAARPSDVRAMQLSDVDLGGLRLTINGRERRLDDLTRTVLFAWLDHRHRRWPVTANPHLLISRTTALGVGPVSSPWVDRELRGLPATLDRIRRDRHLEEALVQGPDPLHLAEVFGLSSKTAIHYARSARELLAEPPDPVAPGTPASIPSETPARPSGSP